MAQAAGGEVDEGRAAECLAHRSSKQYEKQAQVYALTFAATCTCCCEQHGGSESIVDHNIYEYEAWGMKHTIQ